MSLAYSAPLVDTHSNKDSSFSLLCRFVPSFLRLGSWNIVMFVSFEQIKRAMMVTKKKIEAKN